MKILNDDLGDLCVCLKCEEKRKWFYETLKS